MDDVVILNVDTNTLETPFDDLQSLPNDVVGDCLERGWGGNGDTEFTWPKGCSLCSLRRLCLGGITALPSTGDRDMIWGSRALSLLWELWGLAPLRGLHRRA